MKTLLDLTQDILSSLDGEEINSIGDTVESLQVANIIKNSYEEIVAGLNLPTSKTLFELQGSTDLNLPIVMTMPDNIRNMEWVKYDKTSTVNPTGYQDVWFLPVDDFITRVYAEGTDSSLPYISHSVLNLTQSSIDLYYRNDKMPDFYTVIEDRILVFDSYDQSTDGTLQGNKTSCFGEIDYDFVMKDSFVPTLNASQMNLLLNEAKAQAFVEQKQSQNPTAEKRARKGWIRSQRDKIRVPYGTNANLKTTVNYGRKGNGTVRLRNGW